MENFTSIQNSIITSNIKNTAYRMFSFLNSMCFGDKDCCFPSQKYISEQLHVSVRTVQRAIKELVQAGLIKVKRRGSISNIYYILKKVVLKNTPKEVDKIKNTIDEVKKNYSKSKSNTFNNFTQRKYNFNNLEDMLLGNMDYDSEKLKE